MAVPELYRGMDAVGHALRRWPALRKLSENGRLERAESVVEASLQLSHLDPQAMEDSVAQCRSAIRRHGVARADEVDKALAHVVELMFRHRGLRPYGVQVLGAMVLLNGGGAEMATGEGKTLVVALAATVLGWRDRPVHVMTANDYLACRDAENLRPYYEGCGLSVGALEGEMAPEERQKAYERAVVYATANQFLGDYLRDRLIQDVEHGSLEEKLEHWKGRRPSKTMGGLWAAVVDEADSVLVDEALTPLIISMPSEEPDFVDAVRFVYSLAMEMKDGLHFAKEARRMTIRLTKIGENLLDQNLEHIQEKWRTWPRAMFLCRQVLTAIHLYERDRQYIVQEGKVIIVDERTGRPMPQRSWGQGLHQAIEVKEGVEPTPPTRTSARMSFQAFFRRYAHLAGTSGTFHSVRSELWRIYGMPVMAIPRRKALRHRFEGERLLANIEQQYEAIAEEAIRVSELGRPVLVGMRTVAATRELSRHLEARGGKHLILNAHRLDEEAEIISGAGRAGQITLATHMAGRGTDILMEPEVVERGGLHVIATERHESRRVDLQLLGRASRQGQPGSSVAFLCLDDPLLKDRIGRPLRGLVEKWIGFETGHTLLLYFYRMMQIRRERAMAALRIRILLEDLDFRKLLSFSKN